MAELDALLHLQDHDTAADQLRHRRSHLPERAALADVDGRRRDHGERLAGTMARQDEAAGREARLDEQVGAMDRRVTDLERRLYGGEITATRDIMAMTDEIAAIKNRRSALDDALLAVMEEGEALAAERAGLEGEGRSLEEERARAAAAVGDAEAVIDQELAAVAARRDAAAAGVPPAVLSTYEALRAKLGGVGAARLVGTSCSGCHLTLPAAEVARIKREPPDAVILCDQCGRILVRTGPAGAPG